MTNEFDTTSEQDVCGAVSEAPDGSGQSCPGRDGGEAVREPGTGAEKRRLPGRRGCLPRFKTAGEGRRRKSEGRRRKRRGRRLAWRIIFAALLLITAGAAAAFLHFFRVDEWHRFDASLITDADRSVCVYDSDGGLVCVASGGDTRIPIRLETLPEYVKYAFISAEDARFYEHGGVDIVRIFGAAWADIKSGSFEQGASTIGQQLIKLSHLTTKKTFERKLEEAYLSLCMEKQFTKDEILEMYMNYVYFGGGFYGVEAAALGYFGVHASELSPAQAAQLAGILKSPSNYAPHLEPEKSLERRNNVLRLMHEYGHLSDEAYAEAAAEPCVLANALPTERSFYIDYALTEAAERLGMSRDEFLVSGCSVFTAMDGRADADCAALLNEASLFPAENVQGALVLLRADGSMAGICGGRGEYSPFGFNRASDSERQPGSLIKPVLCYAPAIELCGSTAATVYDDSPKSFGDYTPRNSGGVYMGCVTMRTAVAKSLNIPAVETLASTGIPSAVMFAQGLGISFEGENYTLALALGGFRKGISPLEAAGAYAAFSNGGIYVEPYSVLRIERNGTVLYSAEPRKSRAMRDDTAYIMTSMLETAAEEGTASVLSELGFPIAAKTGTALSENGSVRDAWAAAYTEDYTAVMWMGTDDSTKGSLPDGSTGGKLCCPVLKALFERLYEGRDGPDGFDVPDSVESCALDADALEKDHAALLATEYTPHVIYECFSEQTAPTQVSSFWLYPSPPSRVGWYTSENGRPVICFNADDARYTYRIYRLSESAGGPPVLAAELSGMEGPCEFTDSGAAAGETYVYTVRSVHPEILGADGNGAESADSRRMRIYVA